VITQHGFWTRRTTIVPYYRVQTLSSSQNVFQRRRDLATLVVDTATSGGFWGGDAVALDIDAAAADRLRETVNERFHESIVERERRDRAARRRNRERELTS
jgi:putative membrane protein